MYGRIGNASASVLRNKLTLVRVSLTYRSTFNTFFINSATCLEKDLSALFVYSHRMCARPARSRTRGLGADSFTFYETPFGEE